MALTPERIRELWENYSPTKGIESFARSVEAEARRDALEEAAKVCAEISVDYWMGDAQFEAATRCCDAIRARGQKEELV